MSNRVHILRIAAALAYPAIFLLLYFSLAAHLRLSMGRWPEHIADNPDTSIFYLHTVITSLWFYVGVLLVILSVPIFIIVVLLRRARPWAYPIAAFMLSAIAADQCTKLAPMKFVLWWWD